MAGKPTADTWRRWLRISLRALLIIVLITGGGIGWVMHRARVQRGAVEAIRRAGGWAYYDWELMDIKTSNFDGLRVKLKGVPSWPKWLNDLLGADYVGSVRSVGLPAANDADPIMPHVAQLQGLEELYIGPAVRLSDAGMAHLRGLTRLKVLHLPNTDHGRITGEGLKHIGGLFRLQRLSLRCLPFTDADLAPLRRLSDLRTLDGLSPKLTDVGMSNLSSLANLRWLDLSWTRIGPAGLIHLRRMSRLQVLNLEGTHVTDASLPTLAGLPALTNVRLLHSGVTSVGAAKFRRDQRRQRIGR